MHRRHAKSRYFPATTRISEFQAYTGTIQPAILASILSVGAHVLMLLQVTDGSLEVCQNVLDDQRIAADESVRSIVVVHMTC